MYTSNDNVEAGSVVGNEGGGANPFLVDTAQVLPPDPPQTDEHNAKFHEIASTAEEYWEECAKLDELRCHIGEILSPAAREIYGPTWPCSRRCSILFRWPNKRKGKAVQESEENYVMVGPMWFIMIIDFVMLALIPILHTVAYKDFLHWGFHLVTWILFIIMLGLLLKCGTMNPGFVPRRQKKGFMDRQAVQALLPVPNYKKVRERLQHTKYEMSSAMVASSLLHGYFDNESMRLMDKKEEALAEDATGSEAERMVDIDLFFCPTCHIFRAPRTHHCRICNCCVDVLDHHCWWLGSCIGKNNYHYFLFFLFSIHILMGYILSLNMAMNITFALKYPNMSLGEALRLVYYLPIVIYGLVFGIGVFMSSLFLVHLYLLFKGITTAEMLKGKYAKPPYMGVNPWDNGSRWQNVKYCLLGRISPLLHSEAYCCVTLASLIDARQTDLLLALPKEEQRRVREKNK
ncbi:hypothetical protein DQ04_04591050 [Trypanosoma grayi]|uniref:hypothetical protein n=1 Tax=Trypanosoma grayi TaxID=71804 RepID=UPI0004F42512|nr:hypothetical protein DQ04_04591050 [Trypanosoma grayi]KEG09816.1 hypothetical protein DQ04_04591050 [Trypanosoma grayi]